MTDARQMITSVFPGWESVDRLDVLRQEETACQTEVQQLDMTLSEVEEDGIYTIDADFVDVSLCDQRQTVERRTAKQICIEPRLPGDQKIVLNRQKLEANGDVWHRRTCQRYTLGREVRKRLEFRRQQTVERLDRHRQSFREAELNWRLLGAALDHAELQLCESLGMYPFDEPIKQTVPAERVNWLAEGF